MWFPCYFSSCFFSLAAASCTVFYRFRCETSVEARLKVNFSTFFREALLPGTFKIDYDSCYFGALFPLFESSDFFRYVAVLGDFAELTFELLLESLMFVSSLLILKRIVGFINV